MCCSTRISFRSNNVFETSIWLGFLVVSSEVRGDSSMSRNNYSRNLNMVRHQRHVYDFVKRILQCRYQHYFWKKLAFLGRNSTCLQSNNIRAVSKICQFFFSFCWIKRCVKEKLRIVGHASGILLPDFSVLVVNSENNDGARII